jgi:hypothetical protein
MVIFRPRKSKGNKHGPRQQTCDLCTTNYCGTTGTQTIAHAQRMQPMCSPAQHFRSDLLRVVMISVHQMGSWDLRRLLLPCTAA